MPEFINNPTVCVALIPVEDRLLVIRRGNPDEVGYGDWALPGGFQEGKLKENMRVTVVREVREELGIETRVKRLFDGDTDEFGHNVLFFEMEPLPSIEGCRASIKVDSAEILAFAFIGTPIATCFPMHTKAIRDWFNRRT